MKSIKEKKSKVEKQQIAELGDIPELGYGKDLKEVITAWRRSQFTILMMGAHVIKQGLSKYIINWIEEGKIQHLVINGAGVIHDFELSLYNNTSEDVRTNLKDGSFGMWKELKEINDITNYTNQIGYAQGIAKYLSRKNAENSILRACYEHGVTVTAHIGFGCDINHMYDNFDPKKAGKKTHQDFKKLKESCKKIDKGLVLCFGSAVQLPETFLKALNLARYETKKPINNFTAAAFDINQQYRTLYNVVLRPPKKGYYIPIPHELSIPLLWKNTN